MVEAVAVTSFTEFVRETEPRLKLALSAAFGRELGVEATAHALAYGWEHWDRVRDLPNPAGYLWGVGRNYARRSAMRRRRVALFESVPAVGLPWVEPALPVALGRLTERQRQLREFASRLEASLDEIDVSEIQRLGDDAKSARLVANHPPAASSRSRRWLSRLPGPLVAAGTAILVLLLAIIPLVLTSHGDFDLLNLQALLD